MLRRLASSDRPVVEQLWQLYAHDLSEFRGSMPGEDGRFGLGRLPVYFDNPNRIPYLIERDGIPAGFAFIRGLTEPPLVVGEFFVLRALRRRRVGHDAAADLLRRHPGDWEVPFQEENPGAARFWRRVATDAVGDTWREELRPVPDRPDIPPDVWLLLTTGLAGPRK